VSAAHALAKLRKAQPGRSNRLLRECEIVILEAAMPSRYDDSLDGGVQHAKRKKDEKNPPKRRRRANVNDSNPGHSKQRQPVWEAATAMNGNSIVPGACYSVLSDRVTLRGVVKSLVVDDLYVPLIEQPLRNAWTRFVNATTTATTKAKTPSKSIAPISGDELEQQQRRQCFQDCEFARVPPYFAVDLRRCLWATESNEERLSFVRFAIQYLYYALIKGSPEDAQHRANYLYQLAKANRHMYLSEIEKHDAKASSSWKDLLLSNRSSKNCSSLAESIGHSKGFMVVYRTKREALETLRHVRSIGEEAELLDWEDALVLEPHLRRLPPSMQPCYVVRKPDDYTASCNAYVRHLVDDLLSSSSQPPSEQDDEGQPGVQYFNSVKVSTITRLHVPVSTRSSSTGGDRGGNEKTKTKQVFRVKAGDGSVRDFDLLVLAAGPKTALMASQIGGSKAVKYCPTYPLRGFSLTTYFSTSSAFGEGQRQDAAQNRLRQPFKIDQMYFSSVSPYMARAVGFGEFAGYRRHRHDGDGDGGDIGDEEKNDSNRLANSVHSVAPAVLKRYARMLYPESDTVVQAGGDPDGLYAVPCFRAMSPDDLPLVGEIPSVEGLFVHTGHGSLGWTIGLATGEVLAHTIERKIRAMSLEENNPEHEDGEEATAQHRQEESRSIRLSDGTVIDPEVFAPKRFGL